MFLLGRERKGSDIVNQQIITEELCAIYAVFRDVN